VPDAEKFHGLDFDACGLKPIALETIAGFIFINLAAKPESDLRTFLGPVADILESRELPGCDVFSEYRYQVSANWKLAYDNFQEVYHLRWVHANSIAKSSTTPGNPFGYGTAQHFYGQHRGITLAFNPDYQPGELEAVAQKILVSHTNGPRFDATVRTEFVAVFPNLFLFLSKGRYFTQQIWPLAANRSRSVTRFYWTGAADSASVSFGREFAMASTLDVHSEDRDVIEGGQAGLESGVISHVHFQEQEVLCRHFMHQVDRMMQAWHAEQAA
jgi:phenylpropionate dioxygenase-like ring-hydroxylating dioxygenase large terminal subunit